MFYFSLFDFLFATQIQLNGCFVNMSRNKCYTISSFTPFPYFRLSLSLCPNLLPTCLSLSFLLYLLLPMMPRPRAQHLYHASPTPSSTSSLSSVSSSAATPPIMLPMSSASTISADPNSLHQHQSLGPMANGGVYENGGIFLNGDRTSSVDTSAYSSQYLVPIVSTAASVITSHNQQQLGHQQQHHHGQTQQQMFTTLNNASMSNGLAGHQHFGQQPQQPQTITTSSSASFFNTFATNSPPPLTPNGLLSGLHTFLFPDSALGLDTFIEPNDVSCMSNSFLSPSSVTPTGVPHHNNPNTTLNSTSPSNANIRLPPFCTI